MSTSPSELVIQAAIVWVGNSFTTAAMLHEIIVEGETNFKFYFATVFFASMALAGLLVSVASFVKSVTE